MLGMMWRCVACRTRQVGKVGGGFGVGGGHKKRTIGIILRNSKRWKLVAFLAAALQAGHWSRTVQAKSWGSPPSCRTVPATAWAGIDCCRTVRVTELIAAGTHRTVRLTALAAAGSCRSERRTRGRRQAGLMTSRDQPDRKRLAAPPHSGPPATKSEGSSTASTRPGEGSSTPPVTL